MKHLTTIASTAQRYDVLFLDLWGVIHDGSALYDGVHETLTALRNAGKKIVFISNAPRRAVAVTTRLTEMGIEPALYDHAVSSGEVGYHWLESGAAPYGKRYYFIGPDRDAGVLNGLDYIRVNSLGEADFILNVGFGSEEQSSDEFDGILQDAKLLNLPMLCLNPDLEVVKITGERYPCAGVLGHFYESIGGQVTWFGKPYAKVYNFAHALIGSTPKTHILMVGDSLETDIPGAKAYGIDSLLITGGILKEKTIPEIEEECMALGLRPNYIMARFAI